MDETFELKSFESANNVYFAYTYEDGSRDIVYFKGLTVVAGTGNSIQYLRDLSIISISRQGEVFRTMKVPYAKVLPVSVDTLTPTTKSLMGIGEGIDRVPYVMLKSVARDAPGVESVPEYKYQNGETASTPEYMLLSIPYDEFLILENSTLSPESIPLPTLFKLVYKASKYGFSSEVYGQVLMNRLFYPLWMFIVFILLASFAWNTRIGTNQFFKLSWALAFVPFIILSAVYNQLVMFLFHLVNYVFIGNFGITSGMLVGLAFYVVLLLSVSVGFLARHSKI